MRKASASLIIGLVSFLCLAVPSFGMLDMKNGEADLSQEGLTQVDFIDPNGVTTTEYFNPGDVLSLGDAPGVKYNNAFYTWKSDTGLYLHDHVTVGTQALTFRTESPQSVTLENWYLETYTKGNPEQVNTSINTSGSGDKGNVNAGLDIAIDFTTPLVNCYSSSSGTQAQYVYQNEYHDSWLAWENHDASWLVSSFSGGYPYLTRGKENDENSYPNGPFANTKSSIGLETHPADYPNGADMDTAYNQYYKPVNLQKRSDLGDQVSDLNISEYCFARFTLQNDVILSGNFTLGALTGFARQDKNDTSMNLQWTQLNFQGFICGPYSELDLNGYDLIIESGSMLDAFGSVTDSSEERDGRLILKSGATMYSTFVFEDMWRENSIPEIYAGGMDWMQMFRCPYLDCEIVFEAGCNFYGKLYVSFGKSQGSVYTDLHIIGSPSSSSWIRLSSGSIIRKMDYNKELYDTLVKAHGTNYTGLTNDRAYKDVTYQKIKYYFVNAEIEICDISTNFSMSISNIVNINVSITSYRYQKWIPPYFDFYSYGSTIRLHQEYAFMPGCYLYADAASTIIFDYESGSIGDYINAVYMNYADDQKTNCAAGLVLVQNYYNSDIGNASNIHITEETDDVDIYVDSKERKGWYDTRKSDGNSNSNEGHGTWTWGSRSRFWNYYAKIPARFDCYAKLQFTSGNAVPYVLGGEINFPSRSIFDSYINGASVQLWGSVAMSGPSTAKLGTLVSLHQMNIASLYSCPLISNGEIWMTLENGSGLTNTYYDRKTGLINARNGSNNVYYAFIYDDPSGKAEHVYYSYNGKSGGTTNSLSGQWRQVTYSNNIATYNGSTYAFYQGGFMPYRSSDSSIKLNKFAGFDNSTNGRNYYLCRSVTYNSSSGWTITGQVQPW